MSDIVIKAENLGKKYTIGHKAENGRYTALRDVLMQNARSLWHKTKDLVQGKPIIQGDRMEEVWALKDVSFEVRKGEAVGIIGRNGAGKSTLLKVLSRITEPSAGRVTIKGRVASLLEVGTGFHPELTGRENIYLNGTILGMTRQEIKRKFDEIVAFAEVEQFLDTPVKRYSSGMYVRLAFAIAAHLEPEILLVDEVLAVGDFAFQQRCLGKMGEVAQEGRTVLFVSHNMGSIISLCERALLLDNGVLCEDGIPQDVVSSYTSRITSQSVTDIAERTDRRGNGKIRFTDVWLEDKRGARIQCILTGQDVRFILAYQCNGDSLPREVVFSITVLSPLGQSLLLLRSDYTGDRFEHIPPRGQVICDVPHFPLMPGEYHLSLYAEKQGEILDWVSFAFDLRVVEGDYFGTGRLPPRTHSPFLVNHFWTMRND